MKKRYIWSVSIALVLAVVVIAQTGGLSGNQGDITFDQKGKVNNQVWMNCPILNPIKVDYKIINHSTSSSQFWYHAKLNFGDKCVQGIGKSRLVDYTGKTPVEALKEDLHAVWKKQFDYKNTSKQKINLTKGSFGR